MTSPPLMWVEALDRMMTVLSRQQAFDPAQIAAIGGCAQQHGTVYLNGSAAQAIGRPDPSKPLAEQLGRSFHVRSRPSGWTRARAGSARRSHGAGRRRGGGQPDGISPGCAVRGPADPEVRVEQPEAYAATRRSIS